MKANKLFPYDWSENPFVIFFTEENDLCFDTECFHPSLFFRPGSSKRTVCAGREKERELRGQKKEEEEEKDLAKKIGRTVGSKEWKEKGERMVGRLRFVCLFPLLSLPFLPPFFLFSSLHPTSLEPSLVRRPPFQGRRMEGECVP